MKPSKPKSNTRTPKPKRQIKHEGSKRTLATSHGLKALTQSLSVVAETDHYVVVDKPALLDSQNSRPDRPSVVDWLQSKFGYAGLVHRLDFGTSGLMVCAKNAQSAQKLTQDLQNGNIARVYWAVAIGQNFPQSGQFTNEIDGKSAITFFKVLESFANAALLEVKLETGRKHQIRRHFFENGHPLLGDHLYKKKGSDLLFDRPALHAKKLVVNEKTFESNVPQDMQSLLDRLKKSTRS